MSGNVETKETADKKQVLFSASEWKRMLWCLIGVVVMAVGVNLFVVPMGLYSGGFMGISQIIRTLLVGALHLELGSLDIAGIIYMGLNIPVLIMAYVCISKKFFIKTITCVMAYTLVLSLIPIPSIPVIEDTLTSCLIGGIICGMGAGLIFKNGGSTGGTDIIGIYLTKKFRSVSVGRISLMVNAVIYAACLFLFSPAVAIYSIIYSTFSNFTVDKVYTQVINVQAMIMTNNDGEVVKKAILEQFNRGVTLLDGVGGYTGQPRKVLVTVLSKYEAGLLVRMVHELDKEAFVVLNEGCSVEGNFPRHIS